MYRLRIKTLREAAARKGDTSGYAIARRSGVAESSISRILRGETQPGAISLLRLSRTYGVSTDDLMHEVQTPAPAPEPIS